MKRLLLFCLACILITLLWLNWQRILQQGVVLPLKFSASKAVTEPASELEKMAQFGDSFGTLNALFTGLAFAGVAFSVYFQVQEGRARDKEKQRDDIESRFFQLCSALRAHVHNMELIQDSTKHEGKNCFKIMLEHLSGIVYSTRKKTEAESPPDDIVSVYLAIYITNHQDRLGPYFRLLYQIIRYIDKANIDDKEKEEFSDIVRAELSSAEVWLLAIHGLTKYDVGLKPLITKYRLIEYLPKHGMDKARTIASAYNIGPLEAAPSAIA